MELSFLGGAMEVGGSCIYLRTGRAGIVMDCGIRQSKNLDALPDFRLIQEKGGADVILISHAHMDHIGSLPLLSRAYPGAPIYMTAMSADLTRVLLYDSLKIMDRREEEIPYYTEQDVINMLARIRPVRYQTPVEIFPGVTASFFPAGHIAGAACIQLMTGEGTLFYSGDFSNFAQKSIEGARVPRLRPDVAIFESTYGSRLHANRQVEENRLIDLVAECVRQNKKVLIPAFALGRSQEVLLLLKTAMQNGSLPKVPVYVDGMVRDINRMYLRNETFLTKRLERMIMKGMDPFYSDEIRAVTPMDKRDELVQKEGPAIFVASSGMLTGGPSAQYAAKIAPMENGCIIITGYQDEESPGRALLKLLEPDAEKAILINGVRVPVRCQVHQVGLSAHADQSEICAMADMLGARNVFLVHGDTEAIGSLGSLLSADYRRRILVPRCGEVFPIYIGKARKQLTKELSARMNKGRPFEAADGESFHDFLTKNYPGKSFTIDEMALLWDGKKEHSDEFLDSFAACLLKSEYLERNPRRLYLYQPVSPDAAYKLANRQMTMQEVEILLTKIFEHASACAKGYKKFGFYQEEKRVAVSYDFPDVIFDEEIEGLSKELSEKTGWTLKKTEGVNHMAAEMFIRELFGDRLVKVATHIDKSAYMITLTDGLKEEDGDKVSRFKEKTGWQLITKEMSIPNEGKSGSVSPSAVTSSYFVPKTQKSPMEQNKLFACFDQVFAGNPQAPYKRGIKTDHLGKFIELSFLSPAQGLRNAEILQQLADETGHRLHIAESFNQNKLTAEVSMLCQKEGIVLLKNPSWLPKNACMQIKPREMPDQECIRRLKEAFLELSGCRLEIV